MTGTPHRDPAASRTAEFVRMLTRYERQVHGYILSLVSNWADADEILQETNVRLWEQFDQYRPELDFGVWARSIAHFQVLTFRKRVSRERKRFSPAFLDAVAAEVNALADEVDARHHALSDCLQQLDETQRQLLWRCYEGGETTKQIAASLGRSLAATYKMLARLRHGLYECVERKLKPEGRQ